MNSYSVPRVSAQHHHHHTTLLPSRSGSPSLNGGILEKLRIRVLSQHLVDRKGATKPVSVCDLSEEAHDFLTAALESLLTRKVAVTNGELTAVGRLLQQHYSINGLSQKAKTKKRHGGSSGSSSVISGGGVGSDFCSKRSDVGSVATSTIRSVINQPSSSSHSNVSSFHNRRGINNNAVVNVVDNSAESIIEEHDLGHLGPVDNAAQDKYLSTGVIKPHMVRRLQLLHADRPFREAMDEDATQAHLEDTAHVIAKQAKHREVALTMRELDERRREKLEQQRKEREEGKRRIKLEMEAVKEEENQRRINKIVGHQQAKEFLMEQQRLRRETLQRQAEIDRANERDLKELMIRTERRQKEKEREKQTIMKEEVQEYVAQCNQQVRERQEQTKIEKEEERRVDMLSVQLALARERARFGTSKKDGRATSVAGDLAALGVVDGSSPTGGASFSPLHIFASRDRDRSPKVVRKMLGLREAQDGAAARYQDLKASEEQKQAEREKLIQQEMKRKEEEKEERNRQDRAKKLAARATLVKSLDIEIEIHKQREDERQREKERFRRMADEDASKLSQERDRALVCKFEKRKQFTTDIDKQRRGDFHRKLLPIQTKIGSTSGQ